MAKLKRTKDKPTKDGWYWYRHGMRSIIGVYTEWWIYRVHQASIWDKGNWSKDEYLYLTSRIDAQWEGPIEEPEEYHGDRP